MRPNPDPRNGVPLKEANCAIVGANPDRVDTRVGGAYPLKVEARVPWILPEELICCARLLLDVIWQCDI